MDAVLLWVGVNSSEVGYVNLGLLSSAFSGGISGVLVIAVTTSCSGSIGCTLLHSFLEPSFFLHTAKV